MRELLDAIDRWAAAGTPAVLARTLDITGFGAGQYENVVAVSIAGERAGAMLRGAPDPVLDDLAATVLGDGVARVVTFSLSDEQAPGSGLSCGGRARVLVEPVTSVPAALWTLVREGETFALATAIDHPNLAPSTVVVTTADVAGTTGDPTLDEPVVEAARAVLADGRATRDRLEVDRCTVTIDKVVPRTRVLAVGGGEVVDALRDVTRALGWLYDRCEEGPEAIDAARALGAADALVVTTHHPTLGPDVLGAALGSRSFFVGALGSRHTQSRRATRLGEMGFDADDVARIHGPVGLDLGGRTPSETALAICAEILAVRAGRDLPSLRDRSGPINV